MSENYTHINDDLLVKYLLREASPEEEEMIASWTAASPQNAAYLESLRKVWIKSRELSQVSTVNEEAAWQRFRSRIHQKKESAPQVRNFSWLRIAAILLILAAVAFIISRSLNQKQPSDIIAQAGDLPRIDSLPDGSVVTLNKNSSLTYPSHFTGGRRNVKLKGEAFFHISPDARKPFIIDVNDVRVTVVGTSFNVRSTATTTEVIVETGIVKVTRKGKTIELKPAQKVIIHAADTVLTVEEGTDQLYNYYRTKEFVCDDTPLWKLVEVLNEAYDAHIIIQKPEIRNLPLTTTFSNESLDAILRIISETFGIEVIKTSNQIILR